VEGYLYLRCLIDPDIADCLGRTGHPEVEGGDVLREAVLDILEGPGLTQRPVDNAIQEFCTHLSAEEAPLMREAAAQIGTWLMELQTAVRQRAKPYHAIGLQILASMNRQNSSSPDAFAQDFPEIEEALDQRRRLGASETISAAIAALSCTTADTATDTVDLDLDVQWRKFWRQVLLDQGWRKEHSNVASIRNAFEEWRASEKLDRYYASELAMRLEQIVNRAAVLEPVQLEITDSRIKRLFQAAHETFLYGFDVACVALCRSLLDHALQNKLPRLRVDANRQLSSLIERASCENVLQGPDLAGARKINHSGNNVMHDVARLRQTAQQTLDCTRLVLNRLYGAHHAEGTPAGG